MHNQWGEISEKLYKIYKKENIVNSFQGDEEYLRNAFFYIEKLWDEQFDKIDEIKVILISEAPLFGDNKSYIYNVNTAPSSFFHFEDITAFPTWDKNIIQPTLIQEKKRLMLQEFQKNGLIILDIFPFAFNDNDTKLNYRKMNTKLYKELLEVTRQNYLLPKLNKCFSKLTNDSKFVYRYKRLYEKTGNHFDSVLNSVSSEIIYTTDTINGDNMSLNRNKLKSLLKS
jgi:hypothetical protein